MTTRLPSDFCIAKEVVDKCQRLPRSSLLKKALLPGRGAELPHLIRGITS